MSVAESCVENSVKLKPIKGEKIRSRTHRFDKGNMEALSGYSVSMGTDSQDWHHKISTTFAEIKKEIRKAIKSKNISIRKKEGSHKNDKEITFYLSKKKGNYRSEISAPGEIKIKSESSYSFDFKAISLPKDLIVFQVRELNGSMNTLGGDRPSFSLHINHEGVLIATVNTVDQNSIATKPNGKTYRNENFSLNKLELGKYYNIKIDIIMHRDNPSIKIWVDDEPIFQRDTPFGAFDSKTFYSKYGAYAAQQKNKEGINDSEVSFDNIKETHYQYMAAITEENTGCLVSLTENNLLPDAIAVFNKDEHALEQLSFGNPPVTPEITVVTPALTL
ncbi:heparin lyase I family protein [Yersinia vastinensis]|uniref:heparin lyase I family protein n=1 Tax=Yersinia vastinensis TaxID=2890318 RepID=UPI00119FE0B9|nr:heparin lyase I family protein [Yersinia vastinensis]